MEINYLVRGQSICRGCNSINIFEALNLGNLPIANELFDVPKTSFDKFPLTLSICKDCGLGQLPEPVTSTRLFQDYRYRSSMSSTFLDHSRNFVQEITKQFQFKSKDYVLEIASNDGYLLKHFQNQGIRVLGVEPAKNIAAIALNSGIECISEFFGDELALKILKEYGHPKLIVANNVFAHVPNMQDFIKGISRLSNQNTIITIENPPLINILEKLQFDTIYHEHFSYLSINSVSTISNNFNLKLIDVKPISTHGGSLRFYLQKSDSLAIDTRIKEELIKEIDSGLFLKENWETLTLKTKEIISNLKAWIRDSKSQNKSIYGYGAAAKASTIINLANLDQLELPGIADKSDEKIGRFMPSANIPIISTEDLIKKSPDKILIFPWNVANEIINELKVHLPNTEYWICIPNMKRIY